VILADESGRGFICGIITTLQLKMTNKKKAKSASADAQKIFQYAELFRQGSLLLTKDMMERVVPPHHWAMGLNVPVNVLSAFCLELYLKALITIDTGVTPWGHDLEQLFNALGLGRQQQGEKMWIECCKRDPTWEPMERQAKMKFDFRYCLKMSKNAFEEFRYAYEGNVKGYLLNHLDGIIREIILKDKPDWKVEKWPGWMSSSLDGT
jgi:hypothetical protein